MYDFGCWLFVTINNLHILEIPICRDEQKVVQASGEAVLGIGISLYVNTKLMKCKIDSILDVDMVIPKI